MCVGGNADFEQILCDRINQTVMGCRELKDQQQQQHFCSADQKFNITLPKS